MLGVAGSSATNLPSERARRGAAGRDGFFAVFGLSEYPDFGAASASKISPSPVPFLNIHTLVINYLAIKNGGCPKATPAFLVHVNTASQFWSYSRKPI